MKKYTKIIIRVSTILLITFTTVSLITGNWGFLLLCLPVILIQLMTVLGGDKNKYVKKANEGQL